MNWVARPSGRDCYRNGRIDFHAIAVSSRFQEGLQRLILIGRSQHTAIMCAESDPLECHRMILVSRALSRKGVSIEHILPDGRLESNEDAERRLVSRLDIQGGLFEPTPTPEELIERAYEVQGQKIAYSLEATEDVPVLGDLR